MSDETVVLHKYLHLLWSDLSVALWTIILCVGGEERGGGQGRRREGVHRLAMHNVYFSTRCLSRDSHMISHDTPTLLTSSMHGMCWPLGRNTEVSTDFFHTLAPSSVFLLVTSHITTAADELRPNWGIRDRNGS